MDRIELQVVGLSYSQTQTGAYALILGEVNGKRRLPIIIGASEAQAIAIPLEKMIPSRPMTHDLFKSVLDTFSISIEAVLIYNLREGIFYAKLLCRQKDGTLQEIDARSSDAVALALRSNCPIYTNNSILNSAGIVIDEGEEMEADTQDLETEDPEVRTERGTTLADLEQQLSEALKNEEYEKASLLRDEIKRRKKHRSE